MTGRQTVRGNLTVFLALILVGIFAFTGVCLEYARAQILSAQIQSAASAAAESVFAGYHAPLWSEYELFGRLTIGGGRSLEEETMRYADAWGGRGNRHGSLASFRSDQAEWSDTIMLTDRGGAVFRQMASQSMKDSAGKIIAGELKKFLGLSGDEGTTGVLRENAGKDKVSAKDVLSGYREVKEAVKSAEQAEKEADAVSAGSTGDSGGGSGNSAGSSGSGGSGNSVPESGAEQGGNEEGSPRSTEQQADRESGRKYLSLIDMVRDILDEGILALILPEGKSAPDGTIPGSVSLSGRGSGGNRILFREYLMRHMSSFLSDTDRSPSCELEYLIAGGKTDKSNLASCAARLFWIRMGLNLAYLLASSSKKETTHSAAELAVGWTGQLWLVEAVNLLLLSVWAAAESLSDVRQLMAGGTVVLIKQDADWKMDLDSAASAWRKSRPQTAEENEKGLAYEDYLRICLYLKSDDTLSRRGLSVIQWNIRKVDGSFQVSDCMVEGTLKLRAHSGAVFAPLYGSIIGKTGKSIWEKSSHFSYLKAG